MTQAAETALQEVIEKHLETHPLHETVYIKILDNRVIIGQSKKDLDALVRYPTNETGEVEDLFNESDTFVYKRKDNANFVLKQRIKGEWKTVSVGLIITIGGNLYKILKILPNEITMSYISKEKGGTDHQKKEKV